MGSTRIVIASEAKQSIHPSACGTMDCFVAPAQNCFAILSRAPRNDESSGMRVHLRGLVRPAFRTVLAPEIEGAGKAGDMAGTYTTSPSALACARLAPPIRPSHPAPTRDDRAAPRLIWRGTHADEVKYS